MKYINKLFLVTIVSLFSACVDLDIISDFPVERPEDVAVNEFINSYEVLKNYIDRNSFPDFKLEVGVSVSDFATKGTTYGLAMTNFDGVSVLAEITHGSVVDDDGLIELSAMNNYIGTAVAGGLSAFGPALCWHVNQNATYLNELIAPVIVPIEIATGTTKLIDFESDVIGKEYPMSKPQNQGFARVVENHDGAGKVLNIGGPSNQTHPVLEITLPADRKLGDYKKLMLDFWGTGSTGLYGNGMEIAINDLPLKRYATPANLGVNSETWSTIVLELSELNLSVADQELTTFRLTVGSATGSGNYYIDNINMEWETGSAPTGSMTIANFDSNSIGDTFEMTSNGSATVVTDPAGGTNQVVNIVCNNSYPKFPVQLPFGVTLGDCTHITLQFYGTGSTGRYGSGMQLGIDNGSLVKYDTPANMGCADNQWGGINLNLSAMGLTEAHKELREFTITVGSQTGSGDYYIDDVQIHWESNGIVEKSPEEKKEILTDALESWISGMMQMNENGYIKAWDVVSEPMSDNDDQMLKSAATESASETEFYWQDYLGEDYARTVAAYARQYYVENGGSASDLKLFVNEYDLEKQGSRKCERLIQMIKQWEEDNVTVIDGIGMKMNLTYSFDPAVQEQNRNAYESTLKKLAETGKLIRISELSVQVVDAGGTPVNTSNLTTLQQQVVSLYYEFIIRTYFEIIPAAQCYGITHSTPVDATATVGLWDSKYDRKYTYAGFADGLSGE